MVYPTNYYHLFTYLGFHHKLRNSVETRSFFLQQKEQKHIKLIFSIRRVIEVIKWQLRRPFLFFARLHLMNDVKLYTGLKTLYRQTVKLIKILPMPLLHNVIRYFPLFLLTFFV